VQERVKYKVFFKFVVHFVAILHVPHTVGVGIPKSIFFCFELKHVFSHISATLGDI
jgi:hypothetical protein